ncbi:MAG: hypothetical protein GX452_03960 [Ignavibacteriales bacterium]|jgi:hypothetical protein|nr:H-type lectin domain-containing protein [Ignavibacteriaceae bacterium]NLH60539.1 hypothetical protein [Ignavibacteriales bacterium]HOJ17481.1 H-type lectin domain-containing protein [Ignavibacteriaceae bacterium]HPO54769.1 H-type lectin domain-containing protein [Ignavibacteriaceae bacterium]
MKLRFLFFAWIAIVYIGTSTSFAQSTMEVGYFSFNEGTPGYTLNNGEGDRFVQLEIRFTKTFNSKPEIVFSIEQLDCSIDGNVRYSVESSLVTRESFLLKIKTWQDTRIFAIRGKWIAISND